MNDSSPRYDIELLRKRHKDLNEKRIAAETSLKNAEDRLAELKREAKEAWGTDDLDALKQKLDEMKANNEQQRAAYQAHIEQVEARLREVESQFGKAQASTR